MKKYTCLHKIWPVLARPLRVIKNKIWSVLIQQSGYNSAPVTTISHDTWGIILGIICLPFFVVIINTCLALTSLLQLKFRGVGLHEGSCGTELNISLSDAENISIIVYLNTGISYHVIAVSPLGPKLCVINIRGYRSALCYGKQISQFLITLRGQAIELAKFFFFFF